MKRILWLLILCMVVATTTLPLSTVKAATLDNEGWSKDGNFDLNWDGLTNYSGQNEFTITNEKEFAAFGKAISQGKTFKDKKVKIINDIDLGNHYWDFVAESESLIKQNFFSGVLEGNNHKIMNLFIHTNQFINTNSRFYYGYGLFQLVIAATIQDLTIEGAKINVGRGALGDLTGIGVLAGNMVSSKIDNVHVKQSSIITDKDYVYQNDSSGWYIGGLIGMENGQKSYDYTKVKYEGNTYEDCSVSDLNIEYSKILPSNLYSNPYLNIGGFVGGQYNSNPAEKNVSSTYQTSINDCSLNNITINKSYSGKTFTAEGIGGVMGLSTLPTVIQNTDVDGLDITVVAPTSNQSASFGMEIGGIVGYANHGMTANDIVGDYKIEKCSVIGSIAADNKDGLKPLFIGGIAGLALRFTIAHCYSEIDFYQSNYKKSNIYVGNIVGLLGGATATDGTLVTDNIYNNRENDSVYRDVNIDASEFNNDELYNQYFNGINLNLSKNWGIDRHTPVDKNNFIEPLEFVQCEESANTFAFEDFYTIRYSGANVIVNNSNMNQVKFTAPGRQKLNVEVTHKTTGETWNFIKYIDVSADKGTLTVQPSNMVDYIGGTSQTYAHHFPDIVLEMSGFEGTDNDNTLVQGSTKTIHEYIQDQYAFYQKDSQGQYSTTPSLEESDVNQTYKISPIITHITEFTSVTGNVYQLIYKDGYLVTRPTVNQKTADVIKSTDRMPSTPLNEPIVQLSKDVKLINSANQEVVETDGIALVTSDLLADFNPEQTNAFKNAAKQALPSGYDFISQRIGLIDTKNGNILVTPQSQTGLTLVIPYPAGTTSKDDFVILHYKEGADLTNPYDYNLDSPEVYSSTGIVGSNPIVKTAAGLQIVITSFSPFAIGYQVNHKIESSAKIGGQISPSGSTTIKQGDSQTYYMTPNNGYRIKDVVVDGKSVGKVAQYTFKDISQDHTIYVEFERNPAQTYTITATSGLGGNITPQGSISVKENQNQGFLFVPQTGYKIKSISIDGKYINIQDSYEFINVNSNHTIHVEFEKLKTPNITQPDTGDSSNIYDYLIRAAISLILVSGIIYKRRKTKSK